jgi:BetI-type transcriptional repressor, C-terminal
VDPLPTRLERLAERLHVIIDGLAGQYLFYPGLHTSAEMRRVLRRSIDDVVADLELTP